MVGGSRIVQAGASVAQPMHQGRDLTQGRGRRQSFPGASLHQPQRIRSDHPVQGELGRPTLDIQRLRLGQDSDLTADIIAHRRAVDLGLERYPVALDCRTEEAAGVLRRTLGRRPVAADETERGNREDKTSPNHLGKVPALLRHRKGACLSMLRITGLWAYSVGNDLLELKRV